MRFIIAALGTLILGQATGGPAADPNASSAAQVQSVWDLVVKGGPMMIPIGIASFLAFTVFIERLFSLRRDNVIPSGFLDGVRESLDKDLDDRTAAIEYCRRTESHIADIFAVGIKRLGEPIELLEKHVQEAGQRAVLKLRKFLRILSVIAAIAPLMGLLGTIFGMIKAFQTVAMSGESLGKAELLATGIYEAMITTAAGLIVAIPTLIAYHWICSIIDDLVAEMDRMTCDFVEEYALSSVGRPSKPDNQPLSEESSDSGVEAEEEHETVLASP